MLRSVGSVREQVGVYDANRYGNVVINFLLPRRRDFCIDVYHDHHRIYEAIVQGQEVLYA